MGVLIPASQRRDLTELEDRIDLGHGDRAAKRSGYWTMLSLAGLIATAGVIGDSTATVIGAMIVAPLSTPILAVGSASSPAAPRWCGARCCSCSRAWSRWWPSGSCSL
ncbi:MAG TPA: hypothetical protein VGE61_11440 [Glycomyces sp.]